MDVPWLGQHVYYGCVAMGTGSGDYVFSDHMGHLSISAKAEDTEHQGCRQRTATDYLFDYSFHPGPIPGGCRCHLLDFLSAGLDSWHLLELYYARFLAAIGSAFCLDYEQYKRISRLCNVPHMDLHL